MDFLTDPGQIIAEWLRNLLTSWGLAEGLTTTIMTLLGVVAVASFGLLIVIFLIWLERKLAGRFQDRFGPNRVGPYGLLQTIADVIKLFTKEYITPDGADKVVYNIAPVLSVVSVLLIWAIVPFTQTWFGTDLNVGILYVVAVSSFGTLAILMGGWSSNNKFALLGAFRTVAQLVSYEVPLVISMIVPVLLARSMGVNTIVEQQGAWYSTFIVMAPIAALIFFITSLAEVGRTPFDLLEAESEIVAGFHIEYSGMKFGMFFVAEFLHAFTISALTAAMFLGGWRGPGAESSALLGLLYFFIKTFTVYFIVVWIRSTLPRMRIDHMLNFSWKFLTPLSLAALMATAILDKVLAASPAPMRSLGLFTANIIILWFAYLLLEKRAEERPTRQPVGEPRPVARPPAAPASAE